MLGSVDTPMSLLLATVSRVHPRRSQMRLQWYPTNECRAQHGVEEDGV